MSLHMNYRVGRLPFSFLPKFPVQRRKRAEPLLSPFWGDRKRGSAQICFILWSRRSPKSWASHSGLWLSGWFYECEHQLLRSRSRCSKLSPRDTRKPWRRKDMKADRSKTLDLLTRSLSSLSHLGQMLSCVCPQSLVTENLSFYKLINVRWWSQKGSK